MKKFILPIATEFDLRLPYYFAGVGIRYEQEHIRRPQGHPHYQWIQCREGTGELHLRGKTYELEPGKGMLLFPNEPHEYFALTPSWTVDWIIFRGSDIERFILEMLSLRESSVLAVTTPFVLAGKLEELYATERSSLPAKSIRCSALVYEILTDLLRLLSPDQSPSMANRFLRIAPALDYVEENYHRPLNLSELAGLAGLTPPYFCACFKRATSQTPFEYINMIRIRKSKELLLASPDTPIKQVAEAVGFWDASYFSAVFRRMEGMSPSAFCELHR